MLDRALSVNLLKYFLRTDMNRKTLYINGRFLTQKVTGVQRYAAEVVRALDGILAPGDDVRLLCPSNASLPVFGLKRIRVEKSSMLCGHLWEQLSLPVLSRGSVLLNLCNPAPVVKKLQVSLMHDVIVFAVPDSTSFLFRTWHQIIFRSVSRNARTIVTDSEFSRSEIIRFLNTAPDKIRVLHAGCDHMASVHPDFSIIDKHNLGGRPFLFAVSSLNPNKNFSSVIRAMELIGKADFDLVIAGGVNPAVFSQARADFPKHIKYLGYVSDSELKALYTRASCFIYPSFYEGFGLPPLEAMVSGAPVIVSNTASLPEVCGDAAVYVDPASVDSIAAAIKDVMGTPALREQLRARGFDRARMFTWAATAKHLYEICLEATAP